MSGRFATWLSSCGGISRAIWTSLFKSAVTRCCGSLICCQIATRGIRLSSSGHVSARLNTTR